jgi:hypothetical protein
MMEPNHNGKKMGDIEIRMFFLPLVQFEIGPIPDVDRLRAVQNKTHVLS